MTVKIRLARGGAKKKPSYRIVVANADSPRDGKFIKAIGSYRPKLGNATSSEVVFDKDLLSYWLDHGAQPTDTVIRLMKNAGIPLPLRISQQVDRKIKNLQNIQRNATEAEKSAAIAEE